MIRRWLSAHKSAVVSATSGTVIAAVVATTAILSGGYTAQRMELGDGAVWVVNDEEGAVGRASTQVLELNSVISVRGNDLDVVQQGSTVLLVDHGNASLDVIDPTTSTLGETIALPPQQPEVWLAGSDAVIAATGTGEVWVVPVSELDGFDPAVPSTFSFGANSVITVGGDGALWAYSPDQDEVYHVDLPGGAREVDQRWSVDLPADDTDFQISVVGQRWAVLDVAGRELAIDGSILDLSGLIAVGGSPAIQSPSVDGDEVLVANSGGLIAVPLDGSATRTLLDGRNGRAAAPVVSGGCIFAAWAGDSAWRSCGGDSTDLPLDTIATTAQLSFATNGDDVVLNDQRAGASWAVQQKAELIDNWDALIKIDDQRQEQQDEAEDTPPEVAEQQQPPVAVDDEFGARPGKANVLPVLLNDYDANGDVLVISAVDGVPDSSGRVDVINRAQQLQLTLSDQASGTLTLHYTITDGRGGSASATVTVSIRTPEENSAPVQVRTTKTTVVVSGQVTTQVLGDWFDPDGDAFYLEAASVPPDDRVSSKPDGSVLFTDSGVGGSLKTVSLAVSDGSATGSGSLSVTVRPVGAVPIIADPFVVLASADEEVTISPLEHVRGGNGVIRLNAVPPKTGASITPSFESGTFTFVSSQVRTHYIEYVVTDGGQTATGLVRIDVTAPPDPNATPITIPKTVFVRPLGSESIDVAGTDIDPAGGVLLVTETNNVPDGSGVRAEILEQRSVRVTLLQPIDQPVTFGYRVSNGMADAQGSITVIQIPPPALFQPPIARDDVATVRVGDVIDIPVLANDEQPDGEDITLEPELVSQPTAGLLFTSGDKLRFLAPSEAGNYSASYRISSGEQTADAQVSIQVRERSVATNNAPVPTPVVARVLAGETVRIQIPLAGIDPDGDSVQLLGVAENPEKGSVLSLGSDFIEYQAGGYAAGTDTFSYTVMDGLGARATGSIRVGITARVEGGRNPIAVDDVLNVRPSKSVTIRVLANDSDPDGGALSVQAVRSNGPDITAEILDDTFVRVDTPAEPGVYGLLYTIENPLGGTSTAFIQLIVADEAPLARPIANDTVLAVSDVLGRETVDVRVLDNVFFADGDVSTLSLRVLPGFSDSARVVSGKRIRVTVQNDSQIIPFEVTHPEDSSVHAYAFIRVPGLADALPQIDRSAKTIHVVSGDSVTIDLNDYVVALGDSKVRLTDRGSVRATHSDGDELVVDADTLVFTSAPRYFGPASISFEVTDGDPDDPNAHRATLSLPIEVDPRENQPPEFAGGALSFEPGQQRDIDLVRLTSPYVGDLADLKYAAADPAPVGFTFAVNGQRLVISADEDTPKGSTTSITIGVSDSTSTGQAGRITLTVVPSTRPLARPLPDVAIAKRGETTTVDVLANDEAGNPFPGQKLTVLQVRGLDGTIPDGVRVSASSDNSRIQAVVSADAAPGDVNLQYQIADATGDPERYVYSSVRISVQDRPDPVSGVRVVEFGDRTLRMSWTSGLSNNSPITSYLVTATSASDNRVVSTVTCSGPGACTVQTAGNGPDNAVKISVVAINAIGSSDPGTYPGTIWSDIIPPPPDSLGSTPLDKGLRITWRKPSTSSSASPITFYVLRAGAAVVTVNVPAGDPVGTLYVHNIDSPPLVNGSSTVFAVSARNSAPNSLATWNEATATGTPAGPPVVVQAPSASTIDSSSASIGWAGSFSANGKAISKYWAVAYSNTVPTCTVSGLDNPPTVVTGPTGNHVVAVGADATQATIPNLTANRTYNLVVFATNGQGCTATAPIQLTPRANPGTVTAVQIGPRTETADGLWNYTITGFDIASGSTDADMVEYQLAGGDTDGSIQGPVAPGAILDTMNSSQYGNAVTVRVRACKKYPELVDPLCSDTWSDSFDVGVPLDTRLSGLVASPNNDGGLFDPPTGTWSWTASPTGAAYDSVEVSCDGGDSFTPLDSLVGGSGNCTTTASPPLYLTFPSLILRVSANGASEERVVNWQ